MRKRDRERKRVAAWDEQRMNKKLTACSGSKFEHTATIDWFERENCMLKVKGSQVSVSENKTK